MARPLGREGQDEQEQKKKRQKELVDLLKADISWGHQIRSYILDKSLVKDLRTNLQIFSVKFVLDGNIDVFIFSVLKHNFKK